METQPIAAVGIPWAGNVRATGSAFRGGRSLIAVGPSTGAADIAAGASGSFTCVAIEPGMLGKLVLQAGTTLGELTVTSIKVANDELLSGEAGAQMFAHDSLASPGLGHYVNNSTSIIVVVKNNGAASATDVMPSFTAA